MSFNPTINPNSMGYEDPDMYQDHVLRKLTYLSTGEDGKPDIMGIACTHKSGKDAESRFESNDPDSTQYTDVTLEVDQGYTMLGMKLEIVATIPASCHIKLESYTCDSNNPTELYSYDEGFVTGVLGPAVCTSIDWSMRADHSQAIALNYLRRESEAKTPQNCKLYTVRYEWEAVWREGCYFHHYARGSGGDRRARTVHSSESVINAKLG